MSTDNFNNLVACLLDGELTEDQGRQLMVMLEENPERVLEISRQLTLWELYTQDVCSYHGAEWFERSWQTRVAATEGAERFMQEFEVRLVAETQSEQDRIQEIKNRAQQKLEAFLAEQERLQPTPTSSSQRSMKDIAAQISQTISRAVDRVVNTSKVMIRVSVVVGILWVLTALIHYHVINQPVASLERTREAVWLESPEQQSLYRGQLELQQGYAEIVFDSGARVLVEAPSSFQLISKNKMILSQGTLTSQVPPQAHGFTVASDAAEIKDLGTEFGVKVDSGGETEAVVFEGLVELTGLNSSQPEKRHVEANQQVLVDTQGRLNRTKALEITHDYRRSWDDVMYLPQVSGQVRLLRQRPLDLQEGQLESSDWIFVVPEHRNLLLTEDLSGVATGTGVIDETDSVETLSAGSRVDTYILHADSLGQSKELISYRGTVRFPRPILGVIYTAPSLEASNILLGASETFYLSNGLELHKQDQVTIHEDRKSISVVFYCEGVVDQIRIVVEAVPAS